jgi:hypothetical protein
MEIFRSNHLFTGCRVTFQLSLKRHPSSIFNGLLIQNEENVVACVYVCVSKDFNKIGMSVLREILSFEFNCSSALPY